MAINWKLIWNYSALNFGLNFWWSDSAHFALLSVSFWWIRHVPLILYRIWMNELYCAPFVTSHSIFQFKILFEFCLQRAAELNWLCIQMKASHLDYEQRKIEIRNSIRPRDGNFWVMWLQTSSTAHFENVHLIVNQSDRNLLGVKWKLINLATDCQIFKITWSTC